MNKNTKIIITVAFIAVAGLAFFAGTKYSTSNSTAQTNRMSFGQNGNRQRSGNMGGFVTGEVLSKDDKSITLSLRDGSSKIVFFASSTQVTKSTQGAILDVTVQDQVMITGATNSDGSITAQSIQIRPTTTK